MTAILAEPTLVLNRHWAPIRVCTVRRALTLLFRGVAHAILPETYEVHDFHSWANLHVAAEEPHLRAVALRIRVPEVILLRACEHVRRPRVVFSRRNLFKRDRYMCQYCGRRLPSDHLIIDHVIPRARGGQSSWQNCAVACLACNVRKGDRLLAEAGMTLMHAPREPAWRPSFSLRIPMRGHRSWEQFVSDAYWNVELEQ